MGGMDKSFPMGEGELVSRRELDLSEGEGGGLALTTGEEEQAAEVVGLVGLSGSGMVAAKAVGLSGSGMVSILWPGG